MVGWAVGGGWQLVSGGVGLGGVSCMGGGSLVTAHTRARVFVAGWVGLWVGGYGRFPVHNGGLAVPPVEDGGCELRLKDPRPCVPPPPCTSTKGKCVKLSHACAREGSITMYFPYFLIFF